MRRSQPIDLTKVPRGDPWGSREYLLAESLPFVMEQSKEYILNRYTLREQLETSRQFMVHDLTSAPPGDFETLARMGFFPWTEAQDELSGALSHAFLGFHRASYDHQRRGLELILVGSFFISEKTTKEDARKWVSSDDGTPYFTRTVKRLSEVGLYAELEAETGWINEIKEFYWRLSDISHVRGEQYGLRSIQPWNSSINGVPVPKYSMEALEKSLDSFVATVGYIALLIALANPILMFSVPIYDKYGLNGPLSGFFAEWQVERLRSLIPEGHRDALVALGEADPDVESIRTHFDSLPDLPADELERQNEEFESEMKAFSKEEGASRVVS